MNRLAAGGRRRAEGWRGPLRWLALLLIVSLSSSLSAQIPAARIARVVPTGGARGSTLEVTLQGDNLEEIRFLRFSVPAIQAAHKDGAVFKVSIGKDAPLGVHQCWAVGRWGSTYPVSFAVDDLTELQEVEPNDSLPAAQPLPAESVLNGVIQAAADQDHFKLSLKASERIFIDCVAQRIDSNLDPTLRLFDPQGKSLALSRDFQGEEAFLDFTAPADGDYLLLLHDFTYQGGGDRYYRLKVSARPWVDFVLPAAVRAETVAEVKVYGRKLPGGTAAGQHWLDGKPLESVTVSLAAPDEPQAPGYRFGGDRSPQVAKVNLFQFRPQFSGATPPLVLNSLPVGFAAGTVLDEAEPNDQPEKAQPIPVPCDFTGQLATEYDRDWVEFEAAKGQRLRLEVIAARMGSPVDAILTLTRADAASSVIQEVDDDPEVVSGKRFDTRGIDPALSWTAPEAGRYRVLIRDVAGSRKGLGLFYRLTIQEENPDFRVFILSSAPQSPQALSLLRGGSDYYEAHVLRRGGYQGTIQVEATGLPVGVSCPPVVLGPGSSFAPLVFSAEPGAPIEATEIRILACGWSSGERWDRPGLAYVLDRAASDDNTVPNLVRKIHGLPLAVTEEPAPYRLIPTPERLALKPGEKQPVKLKVIPRSGSPLEGEVALSLLGSVPGLKAPSAKIEKGKDEVSVELQLEGGAVPGRYCVAFLAEAEAKFSRKPEEKKQKVKVRSPSPVMVIDVVAPPFEVKITDLRGGKLQPGGSLPIDVAIQKKHGFEGPLVLTLVPPEAVKDLQADQVRLPTGATGGTIAVKALPAGANPGPRPDLILRTTGDLFGVPVSVDLKLALEVEAKK